MSDVMQLSLLDGGCEATAPRRPELTLVPWPTGPNEDLENRYAVFESAPLLLQRSGKTLQIACKHEVTNHSRRTLMTHVDRIPLYRRDGSIRAHTLVDESDFKELSQWCWYYAQSTLGAKYGATAYRQPMVKGKRTRIAMHRQIMGSPEGMVVDHINGDSLDNRRSNLRIVTQAQNQQNRSQTSGRSGYRGVRYVPTCRKPYRVCHVLHGKHHFSGSYDTAEEANEAAKAWRAEHMPFSAEALERVA